MMKTPALNLKILSVIFLIALSHTSKLEAQNEKKWELGLRYSAGFSLWGSDDYTTVLYPNMGTEAGTYFTYHFNKYIAGEFNFLTAVNRTEAAGVPAGGKMKELYLRMPLMVRFQVPGVDETMRFMPTLALGISPNLLSSRHVWDGLWGNAYIEVPGARFGNMRLPIRAEVGFLYFNKKGASDFSLQLFSETDFSGGFIRFSNAAVYNRFQVIGLSLKFKIAPNSRNSNNA